MGTKRFVRSTALLAASGAVAAMIPLAQASAASAATSQYVFGANAFGSQVSASLVGLGVSSGRSAYVTLGCTQRSQAQQNSTAGVALTPITSSLGAVSTKLTTDRNTSTGVYSDTADSTIANVSLLNGAITADAIKTDATASEGGSGPAATATVTVTNLKVGGTTITNPTANDKINVAGVGSVTINSQKIMKTSGRALANVDAIVITLGTGNTLGLPVGAVITIGHANATVGGPASGLLSGNSYGTSLTAAGGAVTSAPSFRAYVNCTGNAPVTQTGTVGSVGSISSDLVSAGVVTDTAAGVDDASTLSADTSSNVLNVSAGALGALLKLDTITVTAHAGVTSGTLSTAGSGVTAGSLKLLAGLVTVSLPSPIPANYQVPAGDLTGALLGDTIELNKQVTGKNGIQVEGLVLTVPGVATLVVGYASAYA